MTIGYSMISDILITLIETPAENWSFGQGRAQLVEEEKKLWMSVAKLTYRRKWEISGRATDEIWDKLWNVNVKGTFYCIKAALAFLRQGEDPAIVNIGSVAGITGLGSSVPYAVTKSAVHGLTKSLAFSLAPDIRVNCIAPGAVDTRWWKGNEEKMKALAENILLKRISTPQDIAETVCYTLVQKSLTGQIITVDNGQTM